MKLIVTANQDAATTDFPSRVFPVGATFEVARETPTQYVIALEFEEVHVSKDTCKSIGLGRGAFVQFDAVNDNAVETKLAPVDFDYDSGKIVPCLHNLPKTTVRVEGDFEVATLEQIPPESRVCRVADQQRRGSGKTMHEFVIHDDVESPSFRSKSDLYKSFSTEAKALRRERAQAKRRQAYLGELVKHGLACYGKLITDEKGLFVGVRSGRKISAKLKLLAKMSRYRNATITGKLGKAQKVYG